MSDMMLSRALAGMRIICETSKFSEKKSKQQETLRLRRLEKSDIKAKLRAVSGGLARKLKIISDIEKKYASKIDAMHDKTMTKELLEMPRRGRFSKELDELYEDWSQGISWELMNGLPRRQLQNRLTGNIPPMVRDLVTIMAKRIGEDLVERIETIRKEEKGEARRKKAKSLFKYSSPADIKSFLIRRSAAVLHRLNNETAWEDYVTSLPSKPSYVPDINIPEIAHTWKWIKNTLPYVMAILLLDTPFGQKMLKAEPKPRKQFRTELAMLDLGTGEAIRGHELSPASEFQAEFEYAKPEIRKKGSKKERKGEESKLEKRKEDLKALKSSLRLKGYSPEAIKKEVNKLRRAWGEEFGKSEYDLLVPRSSAMPKIVSRSVEGETYTPPSEMIYPEHTPIKIGMWDNLNEVFHAVLRYLGHDETSASILKLVRDELGNTYGEERKKLSNLIHRDILKYVIDLPKLQPKEKPAEGIIPVTKGAELKVGPRLVREKGHPGKGPLYYDPGEAAEPVTQMKPWEVPQYTGRHEKIMRAFEAAIAMAPNLVKSKKLRKKLVDAKKRYEKWEVEEKERERMKYYEMYKERFPETITPGYLTGKKRKKWEKRYGPPRELIGMSEAEFKEIYGPLFTSGQAEWKALYTNLLKEFPDDPLLKRLVRQEHGYRERPPQGLGPIKRKEVNLGSNFKGRKKLGFIGNYSGMSIAQLRSFEYVLNSLHTPHSFMSGGTGNTDQQADRIILSRTNRKAKRPKYGGKADETNRNIVNSTDMIIFMPQYDKKSEDDVWTAEKYAESQSKPIIIIFPNGRIEQKNAGKIEGESKQGELKL